MVERRRSAGGHDKSGKTTVLFTSSSHTDRRNSRMAAELGCNAFKLERLALKPTPQRGPRHLFVQVIVRRT